MVIFGNRRGGGGGSNLPKIPKLPFFFLGKIFKFQGVSKIGNLPKCILPVLYAHFFHVNGLMLFLPTLS